MEFVRIRRILSTARRAIDDYKMIEDGDRIAVGLSGGKDSLALLCALIDLKRFYPVNYEIVGITVNMGFEGSDFSSLRNFCAKNGIEFVEKETQLANLIFNERKESNPCSLCARMRRGILHDACIEANCNKLALGHHYDDVINTFMLNLVHEGRIGTFSPVTYLSRKNITMIRPLIYSPEKDIRYFINHNPDLPLIASLCPEDKHTEREEINELVMSLDKKYKGFKHRAFGAIQKSHIDGY